MRITVVIPTFNRRDFVARAVESVLAQEAAPVEGETPTMECIVVDDGSTDGTYEMLATKFAPEMIDQGRLHLLRQENKGVSAARNAGLAYGEWDFAALLDSDDHWLPGKLQQQFTYMMQHGFSICQTDEVWYRRGRRVNPMRKHAKTEGRFFERALEMCLVSPSCVMFTRAYWDDVGPFDEQLPACEDYDLWLRTLLRYDVGFLQEKLVVRDGGRADQLSGKIIGLDLYRIYALGKLLCDNALKGRERALTHAALERKARVYVQGCLKRGRVEEALRIREYAQETLSNKTGFKAAMTRDGGACG